MLRHHVLTAAVVLAAPLHTAEGFWHDRAVPVDPAPIIHVVRSIPGPAIAKVDRLGGHEITIERALLDSSPRYQCTILAHELGHTAGLVHTVGGIMDGGGDLETPWACRTAFR